MRRHLTAVPLDDRDRRGVQPQGASRVAEPAPGPHRLAGRLAAARSAGRRPASQPLRVDGQHPGHRRLLEHQLADQHRPGGGRGARQGRSRAYSSYQSRTRSRCRSGSVIVGKPSPATWSTGHPSTPRCGLPSPGARRGLPWRHDACDATERTPARSRVLDPPACSCSAVVLGLVFGVARLLGGPPGDSSPPRDRWRRAPASATTGVPDTDADPHRPSRADADHRGRVPEAAHRPARRPSRRWPPPEGRCSSSDIVATPAVDSPAHAGGPVVLTARR